VGELDLAAPGPKIRGRKAGDKRKLTSEQDKKIMDLLIDHSPAQLGLKNASWLWTSKTIRLLVEQELQMDVPIRTIYEYRKRWGFLPQKPTDREPTQNPELFRNWEMTEYKDIVDRIKKDKAEIHWFDCAEIKSNIKMLSTITSRNKSRFMLCRGSITPRDYYMFFERLIKDCKRNVFLVLYNHEMLHSELLNGFFGNSRKKSRIELFYIPSELPEHNPIEESLPAISMDILIKEKQKRRVSITKNFSERNIGMVNKNVGIGPILEKMKFRAKISAQVRKSKRKMKPTI
jgi:transposase